jgi:hypothetical protein
VAALRRFVFEIDLRRENSNLEAQRAALEKFLQEHPAPEPYIALKQIDAGGYHPVTIWRLARRGLIDSKREGNRWLARQSSANAYFRRLRGD